LAEPTAPAAIVEAALTRFGTIDVLVNAAGWSGLAAESSPPSVA
jgi:NAD(P)-dependent dehydrogenase (short-subunit alcohol dehydrogenase family)